MRLSFYGHFSGGGSYVVVCRAIREHLERDFPGAVRCLDLRQETTWVGRTQGVALLFGWPDWLATIPHDGPIVGYHVCDVDAAPAHWVEAINDAEVAVATPSTWSHDALRMSGVHPLIRIIQHGLDPAYTPVVELEAERACPRLLHLCSAAIPDRKGTLELLEAFDLATSAGMRATLEVHTASPIVARAIDASPARERILRVPEAFRPPAQVAQLLRGVDALVAPSRAEGFGMIPLEALACGTPVIATIETGHAEYLDPDTPGLVVVPTGGLEPCAPGGGRAPSLSPVDLAEALLSFAQNRTRLRADAVRSATGLGEAWAWRAVLRPLSELLASVASQPA